MRSCAVLVILFFSVSVISSNWAGPYEALYLYYAYRLEHEAVTNTGVDPEHMYIGGHCRRSVACNFNEFIEHVYADHGNYDLVSFDPDTYGESPDMNTMARHLRERGFWGVSINMETVLYGLERKVSPTYKDLMEGVCSSVQYSRRNGAHPESRNLQRCRAAIQGIVAERTADQATGLFRDLSAWMSSAIGVPVQEKKMTLLSGRVYSTYDSAAMSEALRQLHPNDSRASLRSLVLVGQAAEEYQYTDTGQDHANTIRVSKEVERVITNSDPNCRFERFES